MNTDLEFKFGNTVISGSYHYFVKFHGLKEKDLPTNKEENYRTKFLYNGILVDGYEQDLFLISEENNIVIEEMQRKALLIQNEIRNECNNHAATLLRPLVINNRETYEKCIEIMPDAFMWHEDPMTNNALFHIEDLDMHPEDKAWALQKRIEALTVFQQVLVNKRDSK